MFRFILYAFLCLFSKTIFAQRADSIFVTPKNNGWAIVHKVLPGETIFLLSRRFHVPPAILADVNGSTSYQNLQTNSQLFIPIGAYNMLKDKRVLMEDAQPLYYMVQNEDNLYRISKNTGVPQHVMQEWNNMADNNVSQGQVLFIGWVLYDATQSPPTVSSYQNHIQVQQSVPVPKVSTHTSTTFTPNNQVSRNIDKSQVIDAGNNIYSPDTASSTQAVINDTNHIVSGLEQGFLTQTNNQLNINNEKGAAVFFNMNMDAQKVLYAFHNSTPRGTIIKVYNPGTGKTVFVKVLGPLPDTKQYYNCIIGISSAAKAALGVREQKAWCELSYGSFY